MALPKTYLYRVFSPTGTYLGLLQNVVSPFNYNQNIGTVGAQTVIKVAQSADTSSLSADPITDETGIPITDESGNNLLIERQPDLVGSGNANALIANNNTIKIYEISNYYPNGLLVFTGYISKWKAVFGGDNDVEVTCVSNGQDLGQYLISGGDTAYITQNTDDSTIFQSYDYVSTGGHGASQRNLLGVAQTFTVSAVIPVGSVGVEVATPEAGTMTIGIYILGGAVPNPFLNNNVPGNDTLVVSGSVNLGLISKSVQKVSFATNPNLQPGTTYYIFVSWQNATGVTSDSSALSVYSSSLNPYAGGRLYSMGTSDSSPIWFDQGESAVNDAYFVLYQHTGNTTISYSNQDPTFIMTDVMSSYAQQGGQVVLPAAGFVNTGVLTSYSFKVQTILQAIQTIIGLAPANWYWYVDPSTNTLNFAQASTTADIMIIKGRHINSLEIEATKENIINTVYFTGGDDGTGTSTNIFIKVTAAKGSNRTGMAQLSDNRVNSTSGSTTTGRLLANQYMTDNASETYITNVIIQDQTIDTNLFKLGKVVGFAGFGTFVDQLLLMVVGITKTPDQVTLQLGSLPKRTSQEVALAKAQLAYLQTVANPLAPS